MKRAVLYLCLTAALFGASMTSSRLGAPQASGGQESAAARDAARNPEMVLARVAVRHDADREAARDLGTVVADYGPFVVVAATPAAVEAASRTSDRGPLDVVTLDTTISLRGFQFEPMRNDPASRYAAGGGYKSAGAPSGDYYVVQFVAPARDTWLRDVRVAGADVVQYVPNQAFLVHATPAAIETIAAMPAVRWVGLYQPAYKLCPELMWSIGGETKTVTDPSGRSTAGFGRAGAAMYDVSVVRGVDLETVASRVLDGNGAVLNRITLPNNFFNVLRVRLSPQQLAVIAGLKDVIAIDPYIPPQAEDERAAQIVAGNYTGPSTISAPGYNPLTQFGVDGANVTVSVVDDGVGIPGDGGFYQTAANTANAPLRGASAGATGHGHLNATIIGGTTPFASLDPTGYNYGLGVAPKSHIVNVPFLRGGYTGTEADTVNDTVSTNGPNGVPGYVTNNSWGNGTNSNAYDSLAAQYDGFARDASSAASIDPLVIVFSAGNQAASGLTRPKVAKNMISVASSENLRTELSPAADHDNMEDVSDFSSRGLAADGRIKPDITAPGAGVAGGRSGTDALFGNIDANHRWSEGTSHAAPQVAGAAALFAQWWKGGHAGANPSPALVKAAFINGAVDMTGAFAAAARPNGFEGWGRINLKNVLNTGVPTEYVNQTQPLTTVGQVYVMTGTVPDGSKPFRVSLVWTDPPAVSDPALVNNLDLEVTAGGTTYKGNVLSGGLSATGGSFDTKNNVENVYLPAGLTTGSTFVVKVTATALNGDGILGDADTTDQHFALVVQNAVATPAAVLAGNGATITTEGCSPGNGAVDPNETVTVNLALSNVGTAGTSNVVATLLSSGGVTPSGAPQSYGALGVGGSPVTRAFTFTASGACGGIVTATLQLQDGATNLGTVNFSFTLGALGAPVTSTYGSNGVNVPIPTTGTQGTMQDQIISVPDSGSVQDINVRIRLNHSYDSDLVISLVGPDGTTVTLASANGSSGDNFGSGANDCSGTFTVFDDAAATAISAGTAPFAGSFRPITALSAFNNRASNGNWTLKITDTATDDSGSLFCWQLEITRRAYACCSGVAPLYDDTIGVYAPASGTFFLRNSNDPGAADIVASFGPTGVTPLVGDWDSNGTDTVGIYASASGAFFLKNASSGGGADLTFTYGPGGSLTPVVGDWDGNGSSTVGLYDPATGNFFLRNSNSGGVADIVFSFGAGGGLVPVVGDWNNDGVDTIGLYNPANGTFFLKNSNSGGIADVVFSFGAGGATPIAGDWNNDGVDSVGLYNAATGAFFLRNGLSGGNADYVFGYGPTGLVPLAGDWNG